MRESWSELLAAPTKYGHLSGAVPTKYDEDGIAIEPDKGRYEVAALGSETASMRLGARNGESFSFLPKQFHQPEDETQEHSRLPNYETRHPFQPQQ